MRFGQAPGRLGRFGRSLAVAAALIPALLAGTASPAAAGAGLGRKLNCVEGRDSSGGAYGYVCLYQDLITKAVYGAEYHVLDTDHNDRVCAHVRLLWWHENGNGYYDPGDDPHKYYVCGDQPLKKYPDTPQRNFSRYTSVFLQVYVDGGHASSYLLYS